MIEYCTPLFDELFFILNSTDSLITNQRVKELFAYNVYVKTLILTLEKFIGTKYELDVCQKIINKYSLSKILMNINQLLIVSPIIIKNYITLQLLFDCYTVWHHSDMESILKLIFAYMNTPNDLQTYKLINNLFVQTIRYTNISNLQLSDDTVFEKELIIGQVIVVQYIYLKHV